MTPQLCLGRATVSLQLGGASPYYCPREKRDKQARREMDRMSKNIKQWSNKPTVGVESSLNIIFELTQ